jgi:hypothetical protein
MNEDRFRTAFPNSEALSRESLERLAALDELFAAVSEGQDPALVFGIPEEELAQVEYRVLGRLGLNSVEEKLDDLEEEFDNNDTVSMMLAELLSDVTATEAWLTTTPVVALRAQGPVSVKPLDVSVPELVRFGYQPMIEINGEVDTTAQSAEVTVSITPVADPGAKPERLALTIKTPDGTQRNARINRYGMATVTRIPLTETSPRDFTLSWRRLRP